VATFYWVGGSGNWDASDTTNWALSSGGAGGAGVPTSVDDVIFDASSDVGAPFTVTVTGTSLAAAVCNDMTASGLDNALAFTMGATARLDCFGSISLPASNFSVSGTLGALITFRSTSSETLTTNGVSLGNVSITVDGVGGSLVLGSALTCSTITVTNGTFDTSGSNYNVTAVALSSNNSNIRSIVLNASAVALSAATPIVFTTLTNFTFNAGTSTISCSAASVTFNGNGLTFYNVTLSNAANFGVNTVNGANTFNDFTQVSRSSNSVKLLNFGDNQTVNGALTFGATNNAIRRIFVASNSTGLQRTITLNGSLSALSDVDFRDIVAAGTVGTWTGTRLGNGLGNSNITFDPPKTVYRVGTGNWSATQWSLLSGGAVNVNNFPLAQDDVIFDANTVSGTHTFDLPWWVGSLNCSALTSAVTLANGTQNPSFYKNIVLDSNVTLTGTGAWQFFGQGTTQTITTDGVSFTQPINVLVPTGTFQLLDNLTTSNSSTLNFGTIDLNNNNFSCSAFSSSSANTRGVDFGTGKIILTGTGTVWNTSNNTNFSVSGTPVVDVNNNTATATTVTTGSLSQANAISFNYISGTYTLTSTAGNVYKNLNFTGFAGTVSNLANTIYGDLVIDDAATYTGGNNAWLFAATSGTQQITTDGETLDFPLVFDAPGAVIEFQDALTQGATRPFTIVNGTIELKDSVTTTVGAFGTSGSNQKFLQSTTAGVQATLSQASGVVSVNNLTIQDINATGGATWNAFTTNGNVDGGDNTGWDFVAQFGKYIYTRRKNKRILL